MRLSLIHISDDGEDTEGHIPAPVAGAVTFEVDGIAGRDVYKRQLPVVYQ